MKQHLLHTPEGVRDIYQGECEKKLYLEDKLHNILKTYGYHPIQTRSLDCLIYLEKKSVRQSRKIYISFLTVRGIRSYSVRISRLRLHV